MKRETETETVKETETEAQTHTHTHTHTQKDTQKHTHSRRKLKQQCAAQIYNCKEQIVNSEEDEVCVIGAQFDIEPYVATERDYT